MRKDERETGLREWDKKRRIDIKVKVRLKAAKFSNAKGKADAQIKQQ